MMDKINAKNGPGYIDSSENEFRIYEFRLEFYLCFILEFF